MQSSVSVHECSSLLVRSRLQQRCDQSYRRIALEHLTTTLEHWSGYDMCSRHMQSIEHKRIDKATNAAMRSIATEVQLIALTKIELPEIPTN